MSEELVTPNGDRQVPTEIDRTDDYAVWQKEQGVPVITGFAVHDLKQIELAPWARRGVGNHGHLETLLDQVAQMRLDTHVGEHAAQHDLLHITLSQL